MAEEPANVRPCSSAAGIIRNAYFFVLLPATRPDLHSSAQRILSFLYLDHFLLCIQLEQDKKTLSGNTPKVRSHQYLALGVATIDQAHYLTGIDRDTYTRNGH